MNWIAVLAFALALLLAKELQSRGREWGSRQLSRPNAELLTSEILRAEERWRLANQTPPDDESGVIIAAEPEGVRILETPMLEVPLIKRGNKWLPQPEPEGYGLYSYLLFGERSDGQKARRFAAAQAYLALNRPLDSPAVSNFAPENLNLFMAFVLTRESRHDHFAEGSAELWLKRRAGKLLERYDYSRASRLLQDLGLDGDGIYIVSYFEPLSNAASIDRSYLLEQDLSRVPPELIELWILEFRRQVRSERYWDVEVLRRVLLRVRSALPVVANLVGLRTPWEESDAD